MRGTTPVSTTSWMGGLLSAHSKKVSGLLTHGFEARIRQAFFAPRRDSCSAPMDRSLRICRIASSCRAASSLATPCARSSSDACCGSGCDADCDSDCASCCERRGVSDQLCQNR